METTDRLIELIGANKQCRYLFDSGKLYLCFPQITQIIAEKEEI
jgi:hypothetical protein